MPSLYAHKMIADKVFDKLEKPSYIKNNYNEFLLGSIGLEMFNYHRLFKMLQSSHLEQLGSVLKYINHKEFILTLIKQSKGEVKYIIYVLGFITNYSADRTIRPYMHSQTEKPEGGGDIIKQIEFEQALDAYLYRENELESQVKQAEYLQNVKRREIRNVSKLLSIVCRYVSSDKRIWKKDIIAAYEDTKSFTQKIKEDGNEAVRKMKLYEAMIGKQGRLAIYIPPDIITGNDIFNLAHRTWRAPWRVQKARTESIKDLIKNAVGLAVELINLVNDYYLDECGIEEIEQAFGNINFNGREME